jgi:hypothetical protein
MLAVTIWFVFFGVAFAGAHASCWLAERCRTELGENLVAVIGCCVFCALPAGLLGDQGLLGWIPHHSAYALACCAGVMSVSFYHMGCEFVRVWRESNRRIEAIIVGDEPVESINDPY